jgi:uncharacterized membrane protein (DUF485 family)
MIYIFGIKVRTIIWALIGFVLFLIYTQFAYPAFWRKFWKKKEEKAKANKKFDANGDAKMKRGKKIMAVVLVLFFIVAFFYLGTLIGFNGAIKSLPLKPCVDTQQCQEFDCSQIRLSNCPGCSCNYCGSENGDIVVVSFPVK